MQQAPLHSMTVSVRSAGAEWYRTGLGWPFLRQLYTGYLYVTAAGNEKDEADSGSNAAGMAGVGVSVINGIAQYQLARRTPTLTNARVIMTRDTRPAHFQDARHCGMPVIDIQPYKTVLNQLISSEDGVAWTLFLNAH